MFFEIDTTAVDRRDRPDFVQVMCPRFFGLGR